MEYFEHLGLKEEPFSFSPDPDFFYKAPAHVECLHRLEISIRLLRGLTIVLGEVGAGKSTICRLLMRSLGQDKAIASHLLLDPYFTSPHQFLLVLHRLLCGGEADPLLSDWGLKEAIKKGLFTVAVEQKKTVVLIIDEGQKLTDECVELLRELLNYETNDHKLLQIVIFAQLEFKGRIEKYPNFADRINELSTLPPLNFRQTRAMIRFRLKKAAKGTKGPELFSFWAYRAIYKGTGGYPRKVLKLCHRVFLALLLRKRKKAGRGLILRELKQSPTCAGARLKTTGSGVMAALVLAVGAGALWLGLYLYDSGGSKEARSSAIETKSTLAGRKADESRKGADKSPGVKALANDAVQTKGKGEISTLPPQTPAAAGETAIIKSETDLDWVLKRVYGQASNVERQSFFRSNTGLKDRTKLYPGDKVFFPPYKGVAAAGEGSGIMLQFASFKELGQALEGAKRLEAKGLPVRVRPFSINSARGYCLFSIADFKSERMALDSLRKAPLEFQNSTRIIDSYSGISSIDGNVAFSAKSSIKNAFDVE